MLEDIAILTGGRFLRRPRPQARKGSNEHARREHSDDGQYHDHEGAAKTRRSTDYDIKAKSRNDSDYDARTGSSGKLAGVAATAFGAATESR
jgi:hypothetical protein